MHVKRKTKVPNEICCASEGLMHSMHVIGQLDFPVYVHTRTSKLKLSLHHDLV